VAEPAASIPRVVLDTSVLVRGILSSRGPSGYILDSFFGGAFDLVLSFSIIAEVESVLRRRHIRARPSFNTEDSHDLLVALRLALVCLHGERDLSRGLSSNR
jgi:predicted nucleic acid-binding protein